MPPSNPECFRGKRAGVASFWKIRFSGPRSAKSNIKLQTLNLLRI
jgi:hypothetical protein